MSIALPSRLSVARRQGGQPAAPLWVALHGEGHQIEELLDLVGTLGAARELIAPVGCWGTYVGAMDLSNYTWFHEVPGVDAPEPVSFGRSLLDVEQLILSCREAAGPPAVVLFGLGQGATLALALAAVLPDALAAVIAVGGRRVQLPAGAVSAPAAEPPPTLWLEEMPEDGLAGDGVRDAIRDWIARTTELAGGDD